ncbi:MAG: hypothetical protein HFF00_08840 [Ruminiclostridium sp.]|jgi:hypothetical protein|nr:hypothetical protein [Ruminiclostridium sp.]
MKPEECKKSQKELSDIYGDIIRVQRLFSTLVSGIEMDGKASGEAVDALDAAVDYFNRIMEDFSIVMNP